MLVSPFEPKNGRGAAIGLSPAEGLGVLVYKLFDRIVHEHEIRRQRTSAHQPTLHDTFAKLRISLDSKRFSAGMEVRLCRE